MALDYRLTFRRPARGALQLLVDTRFKARRVLAKKLRALRQLLLALALKRLLRFRFLRDERLMLSD